MLSLLIVLLVTGGVTVAVGSWMVVQRMRLPGVNTTLTDATNYPTSSLDGTITKCTKLAGSIANAKLGN